MLTILLWIQGQVRLSFPFDGHIIKFILDTWSFLCSAYKVQTCCHNMICSPASGKTLVDCQLVEVVSGVNTMLIHLQLVTYSIDSSLP